MIVRFLPAAVVCLLATLPGRSQQPAQVPPTPPSGPPGTSAPPAAEAETPQEPRPGRQGQGREGQGREGREGREGEQDQAQADGRPKAPRRGIPVTDVLVHTHCVRCHALDEKQHMTRISYVRKSPEGWSESIKRMGRLHGLNLSPNDAKQLVRSLANSHGLARSEAERGLYESERRVHWSEEQHEQDFKRACAQCHTLGRILLQQRDDEEWQLLRATHVAMFPLARGQMGGGPPEDESRRGGGGPGGGGSAESRGRGGRGGDTPTTQGGGSQGGSSGSPAQSAPVPGQGQGGPGSTQGVGDRVLSKLAKDQPLFTPEWAKWTKNRREVPLAGTWTVTGHETGRGDLIGTVALKRIEADEYEVAWSLTFTDGSTVQRTGKGLLYAGYSWRGRSQDPGQDGAQWREVLLLDDTWQTLKGRMFTGSYDEVGVDLTLTRNQQRARVLGLGNASVAVPSTGHRLDVYGEALPADLKAGDFFVGEGLTITAVERRSDRHATLVLDSKSGTELGPRLVAYGSDPGTLSLQLYDTVDYVRIRPLQGLARVGGQKHPRQIERFEAFAVHRGPDEKPYTEDDVDLYQVRPRWALTEFRVRENDDDLTYVGSIDPVTGVFTPNVDGPNPARKWQANNVGDVFVTAEVELEVAVRPPPPKPAEKKAPEPGKEGTAPGAQGNGGEAEPTQGGERPPEGEAGAVPPTTPAQAPPQQTAPPQAPPQPAPPAAVAQAVAQEPGAPAAPPARERKTFRARSHLIVTVPIYVRWAALEWEDR
ncbi:MAG TPA: quinohemoprotein amine dehydrogenase subunit alpha [Planctomycetota bacterium]